MDTEGKFFFAEPNWVWLLPLLLAAAMLILLWGYRKATLLNPTARFIAFICKFSAICLVLFCLMEPSMRYQRAVPGSLSVIQLVDRSQSMQLKNGPDGETMAEMSTRVLDELDLRQRLGSDDSDYTLFTVGESFRFQEDAGAINFADNETRLFDGLSRLQERYSDSSVSAILLFSDGNATDWPMEGGVLERLPPVFPVLWDVDGVEPIDVSILSLKTERDLFGDVPVDLSVALQASGLEGEAVFVRALDEVGKEWAYQEYIPESGMMTFSPVFRLDELGSDPKFLQIEVGIVDLARRSEEVTFANNRRGITIAPQGGPFRVLYVGGRASWEHKFVRRALMEDAEIELSSLIRVAESGRRMSWQGLGGSRTGGGLAPNMPSGLDEDQDMGRHVFIELDRSANRALREGFPSLAEDLFHFHVLVLDDIGAEFFTQEQLDLIHDFVAERGGALVMLGGEESFQRGGFQATPLAEVLPVRLGNSSFQYGRGPFRWALSDDGWREPWMRLRFTEELEKQRLADMPAFEVLNAVEGIKPAARVLAEVVDREGLRWPALAYQRYGRGKATALMLGDLWRWGMMGTDEATVDMGRAWRQFFRWQVADVRRRAVLESPVGDDGVARPEWVLSVLDPDFIAIDAVSLDVDIQRPDGSITTETFDADPTMLGRYTGRIEPDEAGFHRIRFEGIQLGERFDTVSVESGFAHQPGAEEMRQIMPNVERLQELAHVTGGRVLIEDEAAGLSDLFLANGTEALESWSDPIWQTPWILVSAITLWCLEMAVRRRHGLS